MSMSYLLASTDPETSIILAEKLSQFLKDLFGDFQKVIEAAAMAVIFFFILKELIASFTLTKLLVSSLVGGLAWWLIIGGGVARVSGMVGDETKEGMSTVQLDWPDRVQSLI